MNKADEKLIAAIRSGDPKQRNWAIYQFYSDESIKGYAHKYVMNQGGQLEDVEDVFQESICIFDRNVRQGKFEGGSTLKTYLTGIIKWGWLSYRRKQGKTTELKPEQLKGTVESVEESYFLKEKKQLIEQAASQLGGRCQELLRYYKLDYSMREIQEQMDFSSPAMAKKEAYRCRERLHKVFLKNPTLLKALNIKLRND